MDSSTGKKAGDANIRPVKKANKVKIVRFWKIARDI